MVVAQAALYLGWITTRTRVRQMAPSPCCLRIQSVTSYTFHSKLIQDQLWAGAAMQAAKEARTKDISRTSHPYCNRRRGNRRYPHLSWRSLRGHTPSLPSTHRIRSQWPRLTTKQLISFKKWVASPVKRCKTTTIRLYSTTWKIITKSRKDTFRPWARSRLTRRSAIVFLLRWNNFIRHNL